MLSMRWWDLWRDYTLFATWLHLDPQSPLHSFLVVIASQTAQIEKSAQRERKRVQQLHQGQACAASTAGSYNFVPQLDLAKAHFEVMKQKPARIKGLLLTAKVKIMEWHDQRSFQQFCLLHMWSLLNRCIYMYMYVCIYIYTHAVPMSQNTA